MTVMIMIMIMVMMTMMVVPAAGGSLWMSSWPQFIKLAAAVGMPELSKDPRFMTNKDRTANRRVLIEILQKRLM
jgi:crotonobetainyl-CoA:carnitine CoA-transferase CaiB-like acyl-CoA transferase